MVQKCEVFLQYPKNPKVGPNLRAKRGNLFGFFNISVAKHQKMKDGPLVPFSLSQYGMLREKRGKTFFLVQFARPNDSI